ncbi:MAG: hypothetical protein R3C03_05775 [Pirellulaceae bacterium]
MSDPASTQRHIAFLSATAFEGLGISGGALIVNGVGRPIEFHCSTPVAANRTQEILFGATLDAFLYCEQVGQALLSEMKTQPDLIVVNQVQLAELPGFTSIPVVLLSNDLSKNELTEVTAGHYRYSIGDNEVTFLTSLADYSPFKDLLDAFHRQLPIDEPFERVSQALDEAHAVAR